MANAHNKITETLTKSEIKMETIKIKQNSK